MAKAARPLTRQELEYHVFPFSWFKAGEGLQPNGPDAARLGRLRRLNLELPELLERARAIHEEKYKRVAEALIKARRFRDLVLAARDALSIADRKVLLNEPLPFRRLRAGPLLLYRIKDLEERWTRELGNTATHAAYEDILWTIRDEFRLSAAWDPFLRICVWFDAPDMSTSRPADVPAEGSNDIPILPLVFDEENVMARAVLEGNESETIVGRAARFCAKFQELRHLVTERLRPKRSSFNLARRRRIAQIYKTKPDATDLEAWNLYVENAAPSDSEIGIEAFRRTARQVRQRRRRARLHLDQLLVHGDKKSQ